MATRVSTTGVAGLTSLTWFPFRSVEAGRERGVLTLTVVEDGTSGATNQTDLASTTDGNGSGLVVDLTAAAGVVTAAAPGAEDGSGYRVGDYVTVAAATAGTGADVVLAVASVTD